MQELRQTRIQTGRVVRTSHGMNPLCRRAGNLCRQYARAILSQAAPTTARYKNARTTGKRTVKQLKQKPARVETAARTSNSWRADTKRATLPINITHTYHVAVVAVQLVYCLLVAALEGVKIRRRGLGVAVTARSAVRCQVGMAKGVASTRT